MASPRRSTASAKLQQPSKSPKRVVGWDSNGGGGNAGSSSGSIPNGPLMIGATVGSLIDSQNGTQKGTQKGSQQGFTQASAARLSTSTQAASGLSKVVTKGIAIKPIPLVPSSSKPSSVKQFKDPHSSNSNNNNKTQMKTATNRTSLTSLQSNYLNLSHTQGNTILLIIHELSLTISYHTMSNIFSHASSSCYHPCRMSLQLNLQVRFVP